MSRTDDRANKAKPEAERPPTMTLTPPEARPPTKRIKTRATGR